MMQYDGDLHIPKHFLVSAAGASTAPWASTWRATASRQLAFSETQKFGHVTYFWNGNRGGKFDEASETYVEIPSDRVPFEQRPWMKAAEITDATHRRAARRAHRFVAPQLRQRRHGRPHRRSARRPSSRSRRSTCCLGRLLAGGRAASAASPLVTADHGNADEMYERDKDGRDRRATRRRAGPSPKTSHSLNPVPFIVADMPRPEARALRDDLPPGRPGQRRRDGAADPGVSRRPRDTSRPLLR